MIYTKQDGTFGFEYLSPEYLSVEFTMINKIYTLTRTYESFLDCLGNIGGVFEILMFIFVILLEIHSGITLNLYLLNEVVLHDESQTTDAAPRGNQVSDLKMAQKTPPTNIKRYSYSEYLCLNYFSFFYCKTEKYQKFKQDCLVYKNSLDLKNFVIYQGNLSAMSTAIFKDYQIKLLSLVQNETSLQAPSSAVSE